MIEVIGKIIGTIVIIFIALMAIGMLSMFGIVKSNDAYKGHYKKEFKSKNANAPKALLIYQPSKSKSSGEIAEKIAEGLNEEGYEVTITYPGKHVNEDVSSYTIIGFGSPVFIGKPSAAVTKTMERLKGLSGKKIFLYSVGGSNTEPELDVLKKSCQGVEPVETTKFLVSDAERNNKAYEFGRKLGQE